MTLTILLGTSEVHGHTILNVQDLAGQILTNIPEQALHHEQRIYSAVVAYRSHARRSAAVGPGPQMSQCFGAVTVDGLAGLCRDNLRAMGVLWIRRAFTSVLTHAPTEVLLADQANRELHTEHTG